MSLEFLIVSLIIVVSPGTGVVYTLATGLSRGARASVAAAFGCTIGIIPHMAAAIGGLAAILHTSALAFQSFKYAGVAYLLYLAWTALREKGALEVKSQAGERSARRSLERRRAPAVLRSLIALPSPSNANASPLVGTRRDRS